MCLNRICVCCRGSSAPTRVWLDARICSLNRVSLGLEPVPDARLTASGRCTPAITTRNNLDAAGQGLRLRRRRHCHLLHRALAALAAGPGRTPLRNTLVQVSGTEPSAGERHRAGLRASGRGRTHESGPRSPEASLHCSPALTLRLLIPIARPRITKTLCP